MTTKELVARMALSNLSIGSPMRRFSWRRVRECLSRFPELVEGKTAFIWDDVVFVEMLWSDCLLMLGENRVGICSREYPPKPKYIAVPPKDVQLAIKGILERYGRTEAQIGTPTVH